jgi:hypothetical protein
MNLNKAEWQTETQTDAQTNKIKNASMQKGNMEQTNEKLACKGETQLNEIVSIKLQIIFGSM